MAIVKLQTIRRLLLGIRGSIDAIVALIEAELCERGAVPQGIARRDLPHW